MFAQPLTQVSRTPCALLGRNSTTQAGSVERESSMMSAILASKAERLPPSPFMKTTIPKLAALTMPTTNSDTTTMLPLSPVAWSCGGRRAGEHMHQLIDEQPRNQCWQEVKAQRKQHGQRGQNPRGVLRSG